MNRHIQKAQSHITQAISILTGGMDIRMQKAKQSLFEASAALQLANIQTKEAAPGGGCSGVRELLEQMREDLALGDTLTAGQRLEEALKAISPAENNTRLNELAQEIQELANERQTVRHDSRLSSELYLTEQQLINAAIDLANLVQPQDHEPTPEPAQVERALQDLSVRIVNKNLIGCVGQTDGGAADRALMVARRLLADGQWDGVSQLDIVNPYDVCLHLFSHGMADHTLVVLQDTVGLVAKLVLQDEPTTEDDESLLGIIYDDEDETTKEMVVEPDPIVIPEPIPHHWHYLDVAFTDRTSRFECNSLAAAHEFAARPDVIAYRILDQRQDNKIVFDNGYEQARTAAEIASLGQLMKTINALNKGAK